MIELRNVGKCYDGQIVLASISFTLAPHEAAVISGPSGCGKSTLLRLIAGLELPDSGEIYIDSALVSSPGIVAPPFTRSIGMVFQAPSLWPHMTVRDNIGFGIHHLPAEKKSGYIDELLERAQIRPLMHRYPHQISGGEARRVAILRAIAPRPRILIMDEPLIHLDPSLKNDLLEMVLDYYRSNTVTLIYVTHDEREMQRITDRRIILDRGTMISDGQVTT